ncbi:unnamed protein product [Echinostoma caproni]|uniref:Neogenin_C domain-containing protein n=1 Tax=Echinostoma caproni TaxID=27848 RepID=A0A183ARD8_9TREM|nr:unnamed protein product [Echinostoma caproni]
MATRNRPCNLTRRSFLSFQVAGCDSQSLLFQTNPVSSYSSIRITAVSSVDIYALESVAALQSPKTDDPEASPSTPVNEVPPPFSDPPNDGLAEELPQPPLTRIDSSTRPASPAHASVLWNRPNMDGEPVQSNGVTVTEDEVTALRKERDELVTTIDEMRC